MAESRCIQLDDFRAATAELRQSPRCEPHPEPDVSGASARATVEQEVDVSATEALSKVGLALVLLVKSAGRGPNTLDVEQARDAAWVMLRINADRLAVRSRGLMQRLAVVPSAVALQSSRLAVALPQVAFTLLRVGAKVALETMRFLRQDAVPAVARALEQFGELEAMKIRHPETLPSAEESYYPESKDDFERLVAELRRMPGCVVAAATVLSVRLIATLNTIVDAALDELLHGRSVISRVGLAIAVCPGWFALYHHRGTILKDLFVDSTPGDDHGERLPCKTTQWHAKLARNLLRMPPVFWLTTSVSGVVMLQAIREWGRHTIRKVIGMRVRVLLAGTAIAACLTSDKVASCSHDLLASAAEWSVERLPPDTARAICTVWYELQVHLRAATAGVLRTLTAAMDAAKQSSREQQEAPLPSAVAATGAFTITIGHALHDGIVAVLRCGAERAGLAVPPAGDDTVTVARGPFVPSTLQLPTTTVLHAARDISSDTEDDRSAPIFRGNCGDKATGLRISSV